MSLTNPNTPVSQQDLQDFYHKLLPYMGGSFGMIANKFSKGDMYSTDEKMIGQWIDGKPIYQKTITGTIPNGQFTDDVTGWLDLGINISNIDKFLNIAGYIYDTVFPTVWDTDNSHTYFCRVISDHANAGRFGIQCNRASFNEKNYSVTIQYTKTTDSAISIGDDTDYSTEEKIVGTWLNGEPIWQKTVILTSALAFTADTYVATGIILTSANFLISANLTATSGGGGSSNLFGYISTTTKELSVKLPYSFNATANAHAITIRYTKTT